MLDAVRWKSGVRYSLEKRTWGDYSVVYHAGSGDTHLLDLVGSTAVDALHDRSLSHHELCAALAQRLEIDNDSALNRYVGELLEKFSVLGLAEVTDEP